MSNLSLDGLYNYEVTKITFNPKEGTLRGTFVLFSWFISGDYIIEGNIAQIPLKGQGRAETNLSRTDCEIQITNNQNNCDNLEVKLFMKISDLTGYLTGILNEDLTNILINSLSGTVAAEISPVWGKILESIIKSYLQTSCKKVFINDLFLV